MKKIVLLMLLPFFLFAYSPSALEYLAGEHKWVNDTHKVQYQTIINKKELMKHIVLNLNNYVFNLEKYEFMIFNHFLINSENDFTKKLKGSGNE